MDNLSAIFSHFHKTLNSRLLFACLKNISELVRWFLKSGLFGHSFSWHSFCKEKVTNKQNTEETKRKQKGKGPRWLGTLGFDSVHQKGHHSLFFPLCISGRSCLYHLVFLKWSKITQKIQVMSLVARMYNDGFDYVMDCIYCFGIIYM